MFSLNLLSHTIRINILNPILTLIESLLMTLMGIVNLDINIKLLLFAHSIYRLLFKIKSIAPLLNFKDFPDVDLRPYLLVYRGRSW